MITNEIREDIRDAVAHAWCFCGSWVEHVADVLADHNVTWDLEADKIINQIAFQTLEELSNKDNIK